MICVVLRVYDRWAAVVDSKVVCLSKRKDRAVTLWKAGDERLTAIPIEKFVWLTFLDRRIEVIRAADLVGRGDTYQTVMRCGAKVSEDDKDQIASAISVVRSAAWAQLPPTMRVHVDARDRWWRALHLASALTRKAEAAAHFATAALVEAARASAEGPPDSAIRVRVRARRLCDTAMTLARRTHAAFEREAEAAKSRDVARAAHGESRPRESREYWAYGQMNAAFAANLRAKALARRNKLDPETRAISEGLTARVEAMFQQLKDEDDASRHYRSLGPVWRRFTM